MKAAEVDANFGLSEGVAKAGAFAVRCHRLFGICLAAGIPLLASKAATTRGGWVGGGGEIACLLQVLCRNGRPAFLRMLKVIAVRELTLPFS